MDGKCKPLFEGTTGLYIDIEFAINVLWSRSEYKLDDKTSVLTTLGENIMDHFLNESHLVGNEWQCPYCYLELQMTADVYEQGDNDVSETGVHDKEHGLNNEANTDIGNVAKENNQHEALNSDHTTTLPVFIMKVVLFTVPECQLQNIFDIATGLFGKVINIQVDGETDMQLKVGLLNSSLNQTFKVIKKMNSPVFNCKVKGAHTLKDDKLCSKISITYTEFKPYLTNDNTDIINSFFEKKHIETGEPTDVCITTYYERLQSVDFQILSQGSVIITDARLYLGLIFLPRLLRLSDRH